jgi:pectin methylesterase-like acyl-CoA thioesterase
MDVTTNAYFGDWGAQLFVDVHGRRHGSYRTISEAIVDANPGDYINVCEGVYEEDLHIDKPVQITGEGGDPVTLLVTLKSSAATPVRFDAEAGVLKHLRCVSPARVPTPARCSCLPVCWCLLCSHSPWPPLARRFSLCRPTGSSKSRAWTTTPSAALSTSDADISSCLVAP